MEENFFEFEKIQWEQIGEGLKRKIFGYDDQIMMVMVDFEKGAIGSLHKHPHRQVTYIAKGRFEVIINGIKKILIESDSFFVPPEIEHGVKCIEKGFLIDVFTPLREDFIKA